MLTKRQQEALIEAHTTVSGDRVLLACEGGFWNGRARLQGKDFSFWTVATLMNQGLLGRCCWPNWDNVYLTPTGAKLAAILAKLPAPLTRRQWEVLLRFRDVGSDSYSVCASSFRSGLSGNRWYVPSTPGELSSDMAPRGTNERTIRTLCDYGLLGFEYMEIGPTPYAHLSPLGHELVNLLPATVRR